MDDRKINTIAKDIVGERALVEAAKCGDYFKAKELLDAGVAPDAPEYNRQLFYQSENYMTPLHYATAFGFAGLVKLFIESGANVTACDRFDVTPLHTAAEKGHEDCLVLLLEGEAECNINTKYSKHGSYTAVPHPGGTTPLHLAASHNHVNCVKQLIWNGADYNAVDERCRTSLYVAAEAGFSDCVHAHLDNAIWKDILSLPEKYKGNTPLHECVRKNMLDCARKLLERGSDVNHLNQAGNSPLHLALMAGENYDIRMVEALITQGYNADVNLPDKFHTYTPLHYACFNDSSLQERRPELAVLLLAYGANYNVRNKYGDDVLCSELRGRHDDTTILIAMARCMRHLPSLESLGVFPTAPSSRQLVVEENPPAQFPPVGRVLHEQQLLVLRQAKITWYKEMVRGPRSLQHYCRCVIRDKMGPKRLTMIHKLPLPNTLKEFLLLQYG